jgi:chaperonin GroEL
MIHQTNVPLLVIAEAIEGDALKLLAQNAMRGILNVIAVRAPGFGQDRRDLMEDLATATGAKVRRTDAGDSLFEGFSLAELGTARFVQVGLDKTIIIPPDSQAEAIEHRVSEIDAKLAATTEEDFRHTLTRRKSMLTGGVANIVVGGRSDAEVREKRDLYEDALLAARAAAQSGIVPGAGTMLLRAAESLGTFKAANEEQDVGVHILRKALLVPFQEIIKNGGGSAEVVMHKVKESGDKHAGYDSNRNEYCNLVERGIIDPARVIISEVEHACSMAGLLLSTDVVIGFAEEPDLLKALSAQKQQQG